MASQNKTSVLGIALKDPRSVESDLQPQDLDLTEAQPTEREEDLVELVMDRFKAASEARQLHEREWLVCQSFRMGNQWVEWRNNEFRDIRDPDDPYRNYITDDQIDRLLKKLKARSTMSKPDASVKPLRAEQVDQLAAAEARDVLAHYDRKFDRQEQSLQWVDSVLSTSTTMLKIIWDPSAEVMAPAAKKGQLETQPLGDLDEIIIPPFEVYPDPAAREWPEASWLIHAKERPLSYIQQRYGKRGLRVKGTTVRGTSTAYNYAEARLDLISGDSMPGMSNSGERTACVYECWEKPSLRYPKGRLIRVASGVLLTEPTQVDWPYEKRDDFPFVPLTYEKRPRGLWSLNAIGRLIPLQRALNATVSRIQDRVDNEKVIILEPEGAETGPDAYSSPRSTYRVKYKEGRMPTIFQPSPMNEALFGHARFLIDQMENIAGVHEISNGNVPPGVTAGNAIELLQQSDQTQMSEFVTCIETAQKKRAEWEIALVSQFYAEPRLVAVSTLPEGNPHASPSRSMAQMPQAGAPNPGGAPSPNNGGPEGAPPQQARDPQPTAVMAVKAFEGLTKGGRVQIDVLPGSATPKTPAARIQQYIDLMHAGAFAPTMLPVLKMVADLMGIERSDTFTDRIDQALREIQAQQPDPAMIEKMKAQAQQMAQQADLQHQAEMMAVQTHAAVELDTAQTANKIRLEQAKSQMQAQIKAAESERDHQEALDAKTHDHHHDVAMAHMESLTPTANIGITLDPGPEATVGIERMLGLPQVDDPDELRRMKAAPPAPSRNPKPHRVPGTPSTPRNQNNG